MTRRSSRPAARSPLVGLLALALLVASLVGPWGTASARAATTATAATTSTATTMTIVPTAGAGVGGARSSEAEIHRLATLDPTISSVLADRPDAVISETFRPTEHSWSVHLMVPGTFTDLARVIIDDRTHATSRHYLQSRAKWPPRQSSDKVREVALRNAELRRQLKSHGGLLKMAVAVVPPNGDHQWLVDFSQHHDVILQVEVDDPSGLIIGVYHDHQVAWSMARGIEGAFGGHIDRWYWWLGSSVLFALVLVDWRRVWRPATLDVVAILAFMVSWWRFGVGDIDWSVPLAVPPLAWLTLRMAWLFVRGVPARPAEPAPATVRGADDAPAALDAAPARTSRAARARRRLRLLAVPTWVIVVLAVLACGVRWGVDGWGGNVIDVGYAGVAGAHSIADNRTPYGNMPADNQNGDTYGPLDYVAYLPAIAIWPTQDWGNGLPAAKAVSIASDVLCELALVLVGWRWLPRRAAAVLALAWATCPWTLLALCSNSNDLLVAALVLCAFAALRRPVVRGVFIGAAVAVKFVPVLVAGAFAHCGTTGRWRQTWRTAAGVLGVIAASVLFVAGWKDGWHRFVDATIRFQYDRISPFSPWGLYGWRHAQQATQVVLLLGVALSALRPRVRDFRQVAAGAAAALAGLELTLQHWFYLYLPWFLGLVLFVLVAERYDSAAPIAAATSATRNDAETSDRPLAVV